MNKHSFSQNFVIYFLKNYNFVCADIVKSVVNFLDAKFIPLTYFVR